MKTKIIANYLPQFHRIPENDKWWGEGFTDWVSVKNAKSLYKTHSQPKKPMNGNYYSLDDAEHIRWQAGLANKYGVYGFAIYHYWFSSELNLLQKPAELILENKDIDIHFLFMWDNTSWKRTWSNVRGGNDWSPLKDEENYNKNDTGLLAELIYGEELEWKAHFEYLLPFFQDKRYVKQGNKPLFAFFQKKDISKIQKMTNYWNELAIEAGFDGVACMSRDGYALGTGDMNIGLEQQFRYTPFVATSWSEYIKLKQKDIIGARLKCIRFYDYDKCWKQIINSARKSKRTVLLSGFVDFDDTPRRGEKGKVALGATPQKFEKYLRELLQISSEQGKEYLFLTAWNEWGEGAYLEPDEKNKFAYLEAVKRVTDAKYNDI